MTPQEFDAALDRLGMTRRSYARVTGRPATTVSNWWVRDMVIPDDDAKWIARRLRDLERDPPPGPARAA